MDILSSLRQNQSLPHSQKNECSELLRSAEDDLIELEAEIERAKVLVVSLRNERHQMKTKIHQCQSLLSPVRRLPQDILEEIFAHYCDRRTGMLSGRTIAPALVLEQVCAYWHKIVVSQGQLWSKLHFDPDPYALHHPDIISRVISKFIHMPPATVTALLRRSFQRPLRLEIGYHATSFVVPILLPYMERVHELDLSSKPGHTHFFEQLKGHLSHLRRLTLRCWSMQDDFGDVLACAPNLRSLCLWNIAPNPVSPAWARLGSLALAHQQDPNYALRCISICRQLQDLTCTFCYFNGDIQINQAVSSNVRSFTLTVSNNDQEMAWVDNFSSGLSMPCLATISICRKLDYDSDDSKGMLWLTPKVGQLLQQASSTLRVLVLDWMQLTSSEMLHLLELLPSLTSLTYREMPSIVDPCFRDVVDDALLLRMNVNVASLHPFENSHHLILPKLSHLELEVSGDAFWDETFTEMIQSRWQPEPSSSVACIRSVVLDVQTRTFDESCFHSLRTLRQRGLRLQISDSDGCLFTRYDL